MTLQNLQADFIDAVLSDNENSEVAKPSANLTIYRNTSTSNLIQILESIYPLIYQLVGQDFFWACAKTYLQQYPSRSGNLLEYGEYFNHFLAEYEPASALVYLSEVALFEWTCHQLQTAADHDAFNIKNLELLHKDEYGQLHFVLHSATRLISFRYPILRIIDLCQGITHDNIDLNEGGVYLQIIRREKDMQLICLNKAEFAFLTTLAEGKNLSEAVNTALTLDADFNLEEKLPVWIKNQTIIDCYA